MAETDIADIQRGNIQNKGKGLKTEKDFNMKSDTKSYASKPGISVPGVRGSVQS